jgi:tRNA A37 threonylcarbamoyladenosine biosynthesis protein TsaE
MDAYRLLGDAVHTAVSEEGADIPREAVLDILESLDVDDDLGDRVLVAEWGRGVVETLSTRVIDVEIVRDEGAEETDALADDDEPRDLLWTWIDRGKTH